MRRSEIAYLISEHNVQDAYGTWVPIETKAEIFCRVRSVTGAEWSANVPIIGKNQSLIFDVFEPEYEGQQIIEFHGKRYSVYRTYSSGHDKLELHATEKAGTKNGKDDRN